LINVFLLSLQGQGPFGQGVYQKKDLIAALGVITYASPSAKVAAARGVDFTINKPTERP